MRSEPCESVCRPGRTLGWLVKLGLVFSLLAGAVGPGLAAAGPAPQPDRAAVTVVAAGPGSLTIELRTPELQAERIATPQGECVVWGAAGLVQQEQAGQPVLPRHGALVALPSLSGLRLEVLPGEGQALAGGGPLCLAGEQVIEPVTGAALLQGDLTALASPARGEGWGAAAPGSLPAAFPGRLAELGEGGVLRGQPLVQVGFYPLQVVDGALYFYPQVQVRLSYDPEAAGGGLLASAGGVFGDGLAKVVVNHLGEGGPEARLSLLDAVQAAAPEAAPPALKIYVEQDGIVQVNAADLTAAGWNLAELDARTFKLAHLGTQRPVYIAGEADGRMDANDYLLFYGQAMTGRYTRRNVYWLTAGGANGLRMSSRDAGPVNGFAVAASFEASLHAEEHPTLYGYWQNPPGREAQDHWYWTPPLAAPTSADLVFQMPAFDPAAAGARLRVSLAGVTNDPKNPDHHTRLLLNGTQVHDATWDGQVQFLHDLALNPALLLAGSNTLKVQTLGGTGASVDTIYANWVEIDYQARYVAQSDRLNFGAPGAGNYRFRVSGFSAAGVEAYDITNPQAPVRLLGVQSQAESGAYTAVLEDRPAAGSRYLALTPARRVAPAGIVADQASTLRSTANGADLILISYDEYAAALHPLVSHRQAQGLRTQVVKISDVYDEFSGGIFTPQAVRDFLAYAYGSWQRPAPTYVLLVGDAHIDYLNMFRTAKPIHVPTYVIDTNQVGETTNDNWLACVDGSDPLPDLLLGRFTARSLADVNAMVAKTVAYDTSLPTGDWRSQTLFVSDDDLAAFEAGSEGWVKQVPAGYNVKKVYARSYPPGNARSDILAAINTGVALVSYIGHGNQDRWGSWSGGTMFDNAAVASLTNGGKLPFVATATCLTGFFGNPFVDYSVSEELLRKADGGAVGVWGPSALGAPYEHQLLFGELYARLYTTPAPTTGSLTVQARVAAYGQGLSQELVDTFTLFGDPTVQLHLEPKVAPAEKKVFLPVTVRLAKP